MVSKVNLSGMTPWNFNKGSSDWQQEKLNKGDFAEVLAKEQGRLKDEGKVQQMQQRIYGSDGPDICDKAE